MLLKIPSNYREISTISTVSSLQSAVCQQLGTIDTTIMSEYSYESFDKAFRRFAIRHGLKMSEIGRHESRTMNYKTNFPGKIHRTNRARKLYGSPRKWVRWARNQEQTKPKWD